MQCSLIIAYISFLLDDLLGHRRLTSLFHKKFEFEAGFYSFNSSSIFHFIQIFPQIMEVTLINMILNILGHIQLMLVQIFLIVI